MFPDHDLCLLRLPHPGAKRRTIAAFACHAMPCHAARLPACISACIGDSCSTLPESSCASAELPVFFFPSLFSLFLSRIMLVGHYVQSIPYICGRLVRDRNSTEVPCEYSAVRSSVPLILFPPHVSQRMAPKQRLLPYPLRRLANVSTRERSVTSTRLGM